MIVILIVGVAALAWGWFDGPATRQERGMAAARKFHDRVEPQIASDPRFARVRFRVSTHPALAVLGEVADNRALEDLKALVVLSPDAEYRLIFNVRIDAESSTRPAQ